MSSLSPTAPPVCWVGIDVAKHTLAIAVRPSGEVWSVPTTPEALAQLAADLTRRAPVTVALEPTGGYERAVARVLADAGLPVVVVNARQVRRFAQASGRLAKTDTIDAHILAHFAEAMRPPVRPLPDAMTEAIEALIERRRQVVVQRDGEKARLATARPVVQPGIARHIEWLEEDIAALEQELAERVTANPAWEAKVRLLEGIPGIGRLTAMTLLARLPEIGQLGHKAIAALVGVAPLNRDSGTLQGKRTTWGGRAEVRTALFLPTSVACRYNPTIQAFYTRLKEAGKPSKVALIACMRKLLIICNAMLAKNQPWQAPATPSA